MKYIIVHADGKRTEVRKTDVLFLQVGSFLMIDNHYYKTQSIATDLTKKEVRFYMLKA